MVMKNRTSASRAGAARGRRRAGSLPSEGSRALPRRVLVRTLKTQVLSQLLSAGRGRVPKLPLRSLPPPERPGLPPCSDPVTVP